MEESRKRVKRKVKKKTFLVKNAKMLIGFFVALFLIQSMRGCVNSSSYERELKMQSAISDSVNITKNNRIDELDSALDVKQDFIQYLEYELKIAGVKVDAAEKRALAVQSTAEKVKNNNTTTLQILSDTSRTRIIEILDSLKNEN